MSEKTNEHNDQAEQLKQIFEELQEHAITPDDSLNIEQHTEAYTLPKIDVLNLPPRKEVHSNHGRTRLTISRPFLRLLIVVLLMIAVIFGAYYIWGEELINLIQGLK